MAPREDADPEVYGQRPPKGAHEDDGDAEDDAEEDTFAEVDGSGATEDVTLGDPQEPTDSSDDDEDDDDDGILLTVHPGFNRLSLVLRDEGVIHFVKYVSAAAESSRWDVCGEYQVGKLESPESDGGA